MQPKTENWPEVSGQGIPPLNANANEALADGQKATQEPAPINYPEGITESSIIAYCKTRNKVFADFFQPYIDLIKLRHELFYNKPTGKSGIPFPVCSSITESINSRLQPALLNRPKFAEAVPEFIAPDNEETRAVEDFINQSVQERTRRVEKGKQAIKAAVVEGMMVWRNLWRQETRKVVVPQYAVDPITGEEIYQGDQISEELFGFYDWEPENIATIAWDPHTTTRISDSPWCRKRSFMSYNEMLRQQAEGRVQGVERLRWVVPAAAGASKDDWEADIRKVDGQKDWNFTYADEKRYQVEEWWGDLTYMVNGEVRTGKYRWFLVENNFVIAFDTNPLIPQRIPWDSCPLIISPENLVGLSPVDSIKTIAEQINNFAGYQAALAERSARPTIFYDQSSGLSARTSIMKLHGMVPVQNVQGIKEYDPSSAPLAQVQGYISFLIGLARESSGANEQFQGVEGSDTATEFAGLQAAAGARFSDVVDTLSQGWLEALCTEAQRYFAQFGVDGQMIVRSATTDGQTTEITLDDISKPYTWAAASAANEQMKGKEVQQAMQVLEIMAKVPPAPDGSVFNIEKMVREVLLPSLGQKNGSEWFTTPAPLPMAPPIGAPGLPPAMPPMPEPMPEGLPV